MQRDRIAGLLLLATLAACSSTGPPMELPDPDLAEPAPSVAPELRAGEPRLVPYPGLDVHYVANTGGEVYELDGRFYCFHQGSWFRSSRLDGPWAYAEMKYVPPDLYRVRGQLPPQLAREDEPRVVLVSGRTADH